MSLHGQISINVGLHLFLNHALRHFDVERIILFEGFVKDGWACLFLRNLRETINSAHSQRTRCREARKKTTRVAQHTRSLRIFFKYGCSSACCTVSRSAC